MPDENSQQPRPADAEERMWQNRLEHDQLAALPNIRASAEKWAGTIASLTGVFGIAAFVKGRDDIYELTEGARNGVVGLVVLALIAAFVAIFFAALAAQGTPKKTFSGTPNYKDLYSSEVDTAARQLRNSRIATIVATALLAGAIGFMWFGPTAKSDSTTRAVIVQRSGATVCGIVTTQADGALAFASSTGGAAAPLTDVASFTTVEKCPT